MCNNFKKYSILMLVLSVILGFSSPPVFSKTTTDVATEKKQEITTTYQKVDPLELVSNPKLYLNKHIQITAIFDKFSTLGLDYKPAFRDSQDYISFLVRRNDIKDHVIPLSELKLIIKRDYAEKKLIDIESGDKIELKGKVFSTVLNDPWVEVEEIKILTKKEKDENKDL